MPATSEPAPGSVIPRQPIFSPLMRRHRGSAASAPRCRAGGSGAGPCRSGPRSPCWCRPSRSSSCTRRGPASSSSRRPGRRTPPGSRGRGSRARRPASSPRSASGLLPLVAVGPQLLLAPTPASTRAGLRAPGVKMKCLRSASWSGLMTLEPLVVAVATGSPRSLRFGWRAAAQKPSGQ